jgi:hypothetical protein
MTPRVPRSAQPRRSTGARRTAALSGKGSRVKLWRARRRHHHIDAVLGPGAAGWAIEYFRDDRPLVTREFSDEESARQDAVGRLKELQRVGWVVHW